MKKNRTLPVGWVVIAILIGAASIGMVTATFIVILMLIKYLATVI